MTALDDLTFALRRLRILEAHGQPAGIAAAQARVNCLRRMLVATQPHLLTVSEPCRGRREDFEYHIDADSDDESDLRPNMPIEEWLIVEKEMVK